MTNREQVKPVYKEYYPDLVEAGGLPYALKIYMVVLEIFSPLGLSLKITLFLIQ